VDDRVELRSIRRTNLREEALAVLRAAILGGQLAPGSIHSAVSIAGPLGVSATPVREAMLELVKAELLEVLPNRGFRVTVIDEQDLDEICTLRLMLEVPAIAVVIERASDASLSELGPRLAELEAAAANGDVPAFLLADRAFHLELLGLAGSPRLVRIVAELRDQTRIVGMQSLAAAETLEATAAEHRPILEAVQARDVSAAQRLMRIHIEQIRGTWAGHAEG
jgi:DNA-binding GntR family transcriptional regulator